MNYCYVSCPECEKVKEFVNDRLFQLRKSPRMSQEKRALLHIIELIFHEAEGVVTTTASSGTEEI